MARLSAETRIKATFTCTLLTGYKVYSDNGYIWTIQ